MQKKIAVVGAGTMGNGIAHVFAHAGFPVNLVDINRSQLEKAIATIGKNLDRQIAKGTCTTEEKTRTLSSIELVEQVAEGVADADLVVEAATENVEIKLDLFRQLDQAAPPRCVLATNTSSIAVTRIAAVTRRADKVIGMHFMNPVPVMKLVEIINGYGTSAATTDLIRSLTVQLNKTPCVVSDYPGFISNRVLMPMINEAVTSLFEGVAGVEEIDTVMKLGMAHPMGPLQLADFIGLDVCHAILTVMYEGFGRPHYVPCPLLTNMVSAGKFGVKSGEGFYRYEAGSKAVSVSDRFLKR